MGLGTRLRKHFVGTVPTMLTLYLQLLTSLKKPPLYDTTQYCPYNAYTIDLPKETTSLLRPPLYWNHAPGVLYELLRPLILSLHVFNVIRLSARVFHMCSMRFDSFKQIAHTIDLPIKRPLSIVRPLILSPHNAHTIHVHEQLLYTNSQCAHSDEFDNSGMIHFGHLLCLSQEVLHLLTVMAVASYEVTH